MNSYSGWHPLACAAGLYMAVLFSAVFCPATLALAQETPGNGMVYNMTDAPCRVAIGQSGDAISLLPNTPLRLRNFASYELYLLDESLVYNLDVPREAGESDWQGNFYYLVRGADGKTKLANGLPQDFIDNAVDNGNQTVRRLEQKWNYQINDLEAIRLSPQTVNNARRISTQFRLSTQLGMPLSLLDHQTVAVLNCGPLTEATENYFRRLLEKVGEQTEPGNNAVEPAGPSGFRIFNVCCDPAKQLQWSDLPGLSASADNGGINSAASKTIQEGEFRVSFGEFAGIDSSRSGLDSAVAFYQQYEHLRTHPSFGFLERAFPEIKHDIEFLMCVIQDPALNDDDRRTLETLLGDQISAHYATAAMLFDSVADGVPYRANGRTPLTQRVRFNEQGAPIFVTEYFAHSGFSAVVNVSVVLDGLSRLECRPQGFCVVEQMAQDRGIELPLPLAGEWQPVVTGAGGFNWLNAKYCLRVTRDDGTENIHSNFRPISDKTFTFGFDSVSSE